MLLDNIKLTNPVFSFKSHATINDSRINEGNLGDLKPKDITALDNKVLIGRAPASPKYEKDGYSFDFSCLSRDIDFLSFRYGIDTIIDTRHPKYEGEDCIKAERLMCEQKGVKYVNIPLDSAVAPTKEELDLFFDTINNSNKAYIHCHAGKDRTGILSSCYLAKRYGMDCESIFRKVFDERPDYEKNNRPIERLRFMSYPDNIKQKERFLAILDKLSKTGSYNLN